VSGACPHFGVCGGCQLFALEEPDYLAAKKKIVADAMAGHGLAPARLKDVVACPPRSRRRASIKLWQDERGNTQTGFSAERSHALVPIDTCLVLSPALRDFTLAVRAHVPARVLGPSQMTLSLTVAQEGVDVDVAAKPALAAAAREALVTALRMTGAVRITHDGDLIHQSAAPHVMLDEVPVRLTPRPFLQAVPQAQAAMCAHVLEIVKGAKRVADLFAGLGTFALPLSRRHAVHAVEGDEAAAASLKSAAARLQGRKPVSIECRDLFRRPLLASELKAFDAIVLDPPFQGAREQCAELARLPKGRIAYVSCNPSSFARDAALLVKSGWRLEAVTPIDQFLWSRQVELVAGFTRAG